MDKQSRINTGDIDKCLILLWFAMAGFKILLANLIYFHDAELLQYITTLFFWVFGTFIILRKCLSQGIKFDLTIITCIILLSFSLLNVNLVTFIFALLVWYSIAHMIDRQSYRLIYTFSLLILVMLIFMCVAINGQVYYNDGRYGKVPTFGFLNSNSFPQLLVILFLMTVSHVRSSLVFGLILILIASIGIKTRTMYMIIILYPLLILTFKYIKLKIVILLPLILVIFNFLLVYNLDNNYVQDLDRLLSYRLTYSYQLVSSLNSYHWLIGTSFRPGIPIDMSFVNLVYSYGIIASVIIIYLLVNSLYELSKRDDYRTTALIVCFLFYAFVENVLINYYLNPILFLLFYYSFKKRNINNTRF